MHTSSDTPRNPSDRATLAECMRLASAPVVPSLLAVRPGRGVRSTRPQPSQAASQERVTPEPMRSAYSHTAGRTPAVLLSSQQVGATSVASTCLSLPARRHMAPTRVPLSGASELRQVEMSFANEMPLHGDAYRVEPTAIEWNEAAGHGDAGFLPAASTDTVPANRADSNFTRRDLLNTPLMTATHMETMEDLRDAVHRFVRSAKVVDIEEARMLRQIDAAYDEAVVLHLTYSLMQCAMKENGVFGQRFHQLFREAEAYRAQRHEGPTPITPLQRKAA